MAWNMILRHKELIGETPNRNVRLVIEITDGIKNYTVDWTFNNADQITLSAIKTVVVNQIQKEADLITKFKALDSILDTPIATGI